MKTYGSVLIETKTKTKKCQCMYGLFSNTLFTTESSTRLGFLSDANSQVFFKVQAETGGKLSRLQVGRNGMPLHHLDFFHLLWPPFSFLFCPLLAFISVGKVAYANAPACIRFFLLERAYLRPDHCPYHTHTRKSVENTLWLTYNLFNYCANPL